VLVLLYAIFGGGAKPLQPKTTLVLELKGSWLNNRASTRAMRW
jgi:hypothetical protein